MSRHKIVLDEDSLPTHWYNLGADLPLPAPPLHPGTLQPVGPEDLAPLFPMSIILQEVSGEAQHEIPEEVRQAYRIWRPTPLMRAERFEQALGLKGVRIYYKYEGGSPSGSHKPNTAVPQAFYCAQDGRKRIATETGAGQWGSALAFACGLFGLECEVFMVGISYRQKPYRRVMMQTFGETSFMPNVPEHAKKKIMHVQLPITEAVHLMGSDSIEGLSPTALKVGNNFSISIVANDKADADRAFAALSGNGGTVTMPMMNAPWGPYFGMCIDRFNVQWMVSLTGPA